MGKGGIKGVKGGVERGNEGLGRSRGDHRYTNWGIFG